MCPGQRVVKVGIVGTGIGGSTRQVELVNYVGSVRRVALVELCGDCLTRGDSTHIVEVCSTSLHSSNLCEGAIGFLVLGKNC